MRTLIVLQNCPPKFVRTVSHRLADSDDHVEVVSPADYFAHDDGTFTFNPEEIGDANQWCAEHVEAIMAHRLADYVVVDNCYDTPPEEYDGIGKRLGYRVKIHFGTFQRKHGFI